MVKCALVEACIGGTPTFSLLGFSSDNARQPMESVFFSRSFHHKFPQNWWFETANYFLTVLEARRESCRVTPFEGSGGGPVLASVWWLQEPLHVWLHPISLCLHLLLCVSSSSA